MRPTWHEPPGGDLVPPRLDQNVEHVAVRVDRAPQLVGAPLDPDDDLIKMPLVGRSRTVASDPGGKLVPETANPVADRLV